MWDSIILYFKLCSSGHIISQILVTPYWFKFRATLQPKLLIISFFVKKKKKKKVDSSLQLMSLPAHVREN